MDEHDAEAPEGAERVESEGGEAKGMGKGKADDLPAPEVATDAEHDAGAVAEPDAEALGSADVEKGKGKGSSSDLEGSLFSGASISSIDTLFNSESLLPNKSLDGEGIGDDEEDFCFNNRRNWLASIISACFGGKYEGGGSDDSMCPGFKFLTSSSFT